MFELRFRLVTENRQLLCRASAAHRRLVDLLNVHLERSLLILNERHSIGTDEGTNAGDPVLTTINVNTREVLFGIPIETGVASPTRRPSNWIAKDRWCTRIGIGPYEIVGNVHLPKGAWQREEALTEIAGFFAVTEATLQRASGALSLERVLIVNSTRIDYMMFESAESEDQLPIDDTAAVGY
jgi:hypothetical protein